MRLAILADIHGNLEAFQAVLADLEQTGADVLGSLGDLVGYGPDPEACVCLARELGISGVMGNHELALADAAQMEWFNPTARKSLMWTRTMLSQESLAYLAGLPLFLVQDDSRLVHGVPPESATMYCVQLNSDDLTLRMNSIQQSICFVGHTHKLGLVRVQDDAVQRLPLGQGPHQLEDNARYLVNAGAVGQPRDGDNRAKYIIHDEGAATLEVRFVEYDIPLTMQKIRERGLPEFNATRLL
jgi:predicted phosphodiesterase